MVNLLQGFSKVGNIAKSGAASALILTTMSLATPANAQQDPREPGCTNGCTVTDPETGGTINITNEQWNNMTQEQRQTLTNNQTFKSNSYAHGVASPGGISANAAHACGGASGSGWTLTVGAPGVGSIGGGTNSVDTPPLHEVDGGMQCAKDLMFSQSVADSYGTRFDVKGCQNDARMEARVFNFTPAQLQEALNACKVPATGGQTYGQTTGGYTTVHTPPPAPVVERTAGLGTVACGGESTTSIQRVAGMSDDAIREKFCPAASGSEISSTTAPTPVTDNGTCAADAKYRPGASYTVTTLSGTTTVKFANDPGVYTLAQGQTLEGFMDTDQGCDAPTQGM